MHMNLWFISQFQAAANPKKIVMPTATSMNTKHFFTFFFLLIDPLNRLSVAALAASWERVAKERPVASPRLERGRALNAGVSESYYMMHYNAI